MKNTLRKLLSLLLVFSLALTLGTALAEQDDDPGDDPGEPVDVSRASAELDIPEEPEEFQAPAPAAEPLVPMDPANPAGGYMNLAYLYSTSTSAIAAMDFTVLTHLNYAFGLIYHTEFDRGWTSRPGTSNWNYLVITNPSVEYTVYLSTAIQTALRQVVNKRNADNPGMKVLLSVGGDGCRGFSAMSATPASRARFLQSCKVIVDDYGLDGLDLDWEFPCMDGWGQSLENYPEDRDNYTALVREAREMFGPDFLLTMAGSADIPFSEYWVDLEALGELFDFMNLMTYDFQYDSNYFGWNLGTSRDWMTEVNPTTFGEGDEDKWAMYSVEHYVSAGFPREKILLGYTTGSQSLPEYHRPQPEHKWNWLNSALSASGWTSTTYGALLWQRVENRLDGNTFNGTSGGVTKQIEFHKEWDRLAFCPVVYAYDLTDDPGRTQKLFVLSYHDEQELKARADYIKETGLRGSFFWQYGGDTNSWMAQTVAKHLRQPMESPKPAKYMNLAYLYSSNASQIGALDYSVLTHLDYAFGLVYNTEFDRGWGARPGTSNWNYLVITNPEVEHTIYLSSAQRTALNQLNTLKAAQNPDLKILLSVGGDGAKGFSNMASTPASRHKFALSCLAMMNEFDLAGIDLDWEFPCMDGWGNGLENYPSDRENYTLLVKELRDVLGPDALLTIAGSANVLFPNDWSDLKEVVKYLDFVNLMTYDLHYESCHFDYPLNSSRWFPTYNTAEDYSAAFAVNNYVGSGIPRNKILIGYKTGNTTLQTQFRNGTYPSLSGSKWAWVNAAQTALNWNVAANGTYTWQRVLNGLDGKTATVTSGGVTKTIEFHRFWDRYAGLSEVIAYDLTADPGRTEKLLYMSYHDPQGLANRAKYIKDNGLLGSFFWQYTGDTNSWMATEMYNNLGITKEPEPEPELVWPYTPTEWVLFNMAKIDLDKHGFGQYDTIHTIKRALGSPVDTQDRQGGNTTYSTIGGSFWSSFTTAQKNEFLQPTGEYYALYQNMLDQEALMLKIWLEGLLVPQPGESWQHHDARIGQLYAMFVDTPGYYYYVDRDRRINILGARHYADNPLVQQIGVIADGYGAKFTAECYVPGKAVERQIALMDPTNAAAVAAARVEYDKLDNLGKSCVMNYELLTRAEGFVYPDGTDRQMENIVSVGMRKPTNQDTGFTASNHQSALSDMLRALPEAEPWYIWISGVNTGALMAGTTSWDTLAASGKLQYPVDYYQGMGITLQADPVGDAFFAYLDANYPDAEVYLQVENMNRLVEPQMDVLRHRAAQFNCIKGFAMDIEWYNHNTEDCGLRVSDYRARAWNEYIYKTWGPEYSLAIKHYDAAHMPETYRGGGDGVSNPIIIVYDGQNVGSWDGTHGGRYDGATAGNGSVPGLGGFWVRYAQYFYPTPVIFQTGYSNDNHWMYEMDAVDFDNPLFLRSYANKCAEVLTPGHRFGMAWVNFNRNCYPEFPNANWRTPATHLTELTSRTINYLQNYNGNSNYMLGGIWGFYSNAAGRARNQENNPLTYYDGMWVYNVRQYANALIAKGAPAANFTGNTYYTRFLGIEVRSFDIMVQHRYDIIKDTGYIPERDLKDILMLYNMYNGLSTTATCVFPAAPDAVDGYVNGTIQRNAVTKYALYKELLKISRYITPSLSVVNVRKGGTATIAIDKNFAAAVEFSSAVPMFATVSQSGVVTGVAAGISVIRITDPESGLTVNVPVNVVN